MLLVKMGSDAYTKRRSRRLRKGWACFAGACLLLSAVGVCAFFWFSLSASSTSSSPSFSSRSLFSSLLPLQDRSNRNSNMGLSLCPSGYKSGTGCHVIDLHTAHGIEDLRKLAAERFSCSILEDDISGRCRLFDVDGLELRFEKQLDELHNGSVVHVIRGDNHFFWPTVRLGYKWQPKHVKSPDPNKPITLETISESPRVFLIENFLSNAEIDYLVHHAEGRLQRSHVGIGKETFHSQRTSKTAWDTGSITSLEIQHRAYDLVRQPYERNTADAIQVIKYDRGQMYLLHTDYFKVGYDNLDSSKPDGTNRIITIFMYLSDVEAGGATVFPHATHHMKVRDDRSIVSPPDYLLKRIKSENRKMADCSLVNALQVHPKRGRAVLFYNQLPDGTLDINAEHGGCPVAVGHKWAANVWIWNRNRPRFGSGGKQINQKKHGGLLSWFKGEKHTKVDTHRMKMEFSNERSSTVELFWQKTNGGGETSFGTITPGNRMPVNTFEGHVWIVRDTRSHAIIKRVVAREGSGSAISIL